MMLDILMLDILQAYTEHRLLNDSFSAASNWLHCSSQQIWLRCYVCCDETIPVLTLQRLFLIINMNNISEVQNICIIPYKVQA